MDALKLILVTIIGGLVAYLQPVHNAMIVLTFVFMADMFFGVITDIFVNKTRFKPKKFMLAFFYVAIYLSIVASIYIIGERMGDTQESLFIVKTITYVFIYFYITNTLRNLNALLPGNKAIAFLDFALGLEFLKRIPMLGSFIESEKKKQDP